MKKFDTLLHLSWMRYFLPLCGMTLPGMEKWVIVPKITMPFLRKSSYIISAFLLSYSANMFGSLIFGKDNTLQEAVTYVVVGFNASSVAIRVFIIRSSIKLVHRAVKQIDENLQNPMQMKTRRDEIKKKIGLINVIYLVWLVIQLSNALSTEFYSAVFKHRNSHPSAFQVDTNNIWVFVPFVIYEMMTSCSYIFAQASFEWSFLAFIRLITVEMQVLREQLNAVFSALRTDAVSVIQIRKNLHQATLNNVAGSEHNADWLAIKEYPSFYKEKMNLLEDALNKFLSHHIETIQLSRTVRKVYGLTVLLSYLHTVVMSTTWILTARREASSSEEKDTSFIATLSLLAFLTLFLTSYYGEQCLSAGHDVASDAYGMEWHLYPISMQKKLLLTLHICQRPLHMDIFGIEPLCLATYTAVVQFCYSLFSLFSTKS